MKNLIERNDISENLKAQKAYVKFAELLKELKSKDLPTETVILVNAELDKLNLIFSTDKKFFRLIKDKENKILRLIENKHKIVPINYYRNLWMLLGMSSFGIPLGVVFGFSIGNLALLGIGIPIGMAIGIGFGTYLDKKANEEGRQLQYKV
jgi:hypothetical protein